MDRRVLKTDEVVKLPGALVVQSPQTKEKEETGQQNKEDAQKLVQNLKVEADQFKMRWNIERESIIAQARSDAELIIEEAEKRGEEIVESKVQESENIIAEANKKANQVVEEAETNSHQIKEQTEKEIEEKRAIQYQESEQQGYDKGFQEGSKDAQRIIEQLHNILNSIIDRRATLVEEIEPQVVQLVLMIVRKIVKAMSEEQRTVVVNNVIYALRKLKRKSEVVLRVNFENLGIVNQHMEKIIQLIGKVEKVTVVEDTSVDPGGCIVETDFGRVDARIATQLDEIEQRIRKMIPVKVERSLL